MSSEPTYDDLWGALTSDEKREACLAVWQSTDTMSEQARKRLLPTLPKRFVFGRFFCDGNPPLKRPSSWED